jgi:chemotaxis regulatin CheY-phosphate phosphatase CheZ
MSLKDGNLTVKEYHTCVKEIQSAILDATQRVSYQVRTIAVAVAVAVAVAEPTKPAVQIANEVMEAAIEKYEGMLKCIIWTF